MKRVEVKTRWQSELSPSQATPMQKQTASSKLNYLALFICSKRIWTHLLWHYTKTVFCAYAIILLLSYTVKHTFVAQQSHQWSSGSLASVPTLLNTILLIPLSAIQPAYAHQDPASLKGKNYVT